MAVQSRLILREDLLVWDHFCTKFSLNLNFSYRYLSIAKCFPSIGNESLNSIILMLCPQMIKGLSVSCIAGFVSALTGLITNALFYFNHKGCRNTLDNLVLVTSTVAHITCILSVLSLIPGITNTVKSCFSTLESKISYIAETFIKWIGSDDSVGIYQASQSSSLDTTEEELRERFLNLTRVDDPPAYSDLSLDGSTHGSGNMDPVASWDSSINLSQLSFDRQSADTITQESLSVGTYISMAVSFVGFLGFIAVIAAQTGRSVSPYLSCFTGFVAISSSVTKLVQWVGEHMMGTDISGDEPFIAKYHALVERIMNYHSMPRHLFSLFPRMWKNYRACVAEHNEMSQLIFKRVGESKFRGLVTTCTNIKGKCADVLREVTDTNGTSSIKFEPVVVSIYGDKGIGKSTYVAQKLIPDLAKKLDMNATVYPLTVTTGSNYYPVTKGENFAVVDEFGSGGDEDFVVAEFNKIVSPTPHVAEAAKVEHKNQELRFYFVVTIANDPFPKKPRKMGNAAFEGTLRRINPVTRVSQVPNSSMVTGSFGHLTFQKEIYSMRNNVMIATPSSSSQTSHQGIIDDAVARFAKNQQMWYQNCKAAFSDLTSLPKIDVGVEQLNSVEIECCRQIGLKFIGTTSASIQQNLDCKTYIRDNSNFPTVINESNNTKCFVARMYGPSSGGKSYAFSKVIQDITSKYPFFVFGSIAEAQIHVKAHPSKPLILHLEDFFIYDGKDIDIERVYEYCHFYDSLPAGSLIFLSDNIPTGVSRLSYIERIKHLAISTINRRKVDTLTRYLDFSMFPETIVRRLGCYVPAKHSTGFMNALPGAWGYTFYTNGVDVTEFSMDGDYLQEKNFNSGSIISHVIREVSRYISCTSAPEIRMVSLSEFPVIIPNVTVPNVTTLCRAARGDPQAVHVIFSGLSGNVLQLKGLERLYNFLPRDINLRDMTTQDIFRACEIVATRAALAGEQKDWSITIGTLDKIGVKDGIIYKTGSIHEKLRIVNNTLQIADDLMWIVITRPEIQALCDGHFHLVRSNVLKMIYVHFGSVKYFQSQDLFQNIIVSYNVKNLVLAEQNRVQSSMKSVALKIVAVSLAIPFIMLLGFCLGRKVKSISDYFSYTPEKQSDTDESREKKSGNTLQNKCTLSSTQNNAKQNSRSDSSNWRTTQQMGSITNEGLNESQQEQLTAIHAKVNTNLVRIFSPYGHVYGLGLYENVIMFPAHVVPKMDRSSLTVYHKDQEYILRNILFVENNDLAVGQMVAVNARTGTCVFKDITKHFIFGEGSINYENATFYTERNRQLIQCNFPMEFEEREFVGGEGDYHKGLIGFPRNIANQPSTQAGDCGRPYFIENSSNISRCITGIHLGKTNNFRQGSIVNAVITSAFMDAVKSSYVINESGPLQLEPMDGSTYFCSSHPIVLDEFAQDYIVPITPQDQNVIPENLQQKLLPIASTRMRAIPHPKYSTIKSLPVPFEFDDIVPVNFCIDDSNKFKYKWPNNQIFYDNDGLPSPLIAGICKYAIDDLPDLDTTTLSSISEVMNATEVLLKNHLNINLGKQGLRPLGIREVINGFGSEKDQWYFPPLNKNSKAGIYATWVSGKHAGLSPRKSDFMSQITHKDIPIWVLNSDGPAAKIRTRYYERIELAKQGKNLFSVSKCCLKDEKLPKGKLPRLFENLDMDLQMAIRSYTGQYSAMVNSFRGFHWAFRCNADTDFALYANYLNNTTAKYKGKLLYWCADAKRLDGKSHPVVARCHMADFMPRFYGPEYEKVFSVLADNIIFTISQADRLLFIKTRGNPSGNPLTTIKNTIEMDWKEYVVWKNIFRIFNVPFSITDWILGNKVRCMRLGDDVVGAIYLPIEVPRVHLFALYKQVWATIWGIEITWGAKAVAMEDFVENLEDTTFLSRTFILDSNNTYKGALKVETIKSMLVYTISHTQEQVLENWKNALAEAKIHGTEFYKATVNAMIIMVRYMQKSYEESCTFHIDYGHFASMVREMRIPLLVPFTLNSWNMFGSSNAQEDCLSEDDLHEFKTLGDKTEALISMKDTWLSPTDHQFSWTIMKPLETPDWLYYARDSPLSRGEEFEIVFDKPVIVRFNEKAICNLKITDKSSNNTDNIQVSNKPQIVRDRKIVYTEEVSLVS